MSETSEIAEAYKAQREASKAKKESNIERSTNLLTEKGIKFEKKNFGIHLIVEGKNGKIDFWPSTGKFIVRNGKSGRGVFNLLKLCETA